MKIYKIYAASLLLISFLSASFVACKKDKGYASTRQTLIKIKDAEDGLTVYARDVDPPTETFQLADIRRDATNNAELNQSVTVTIAIDQSVLDEYNTDNNTSFVMLPANAYTLSENLSNLTFASGEFAKTVMITLNKGLLDLSQQYALALKITNVSSGAVASVDYSKAVYSIGVKNKYDGHYEVTGTMVDFSNSALTGDYPFECDLETAGATSVLMYNYTGNFVGYYHPILSAGASSAYGNYVPVFIFDANDNIVGITNGYGQGAGGRSAELDPSGLNKRNPDGSIDVSYWMNQPSVFTPHRTSFVEHFTYLGPR